MYNYQASRIFFSFIFFICPGIYSQTQNLNFERLTGDDGLPSGSVYCVYKDAKGFIWFGTSGGLARFDGYDFKVYSTSPDKPGGISYNEVRCIFEDSEGYLWCGTDYGLNKLDRDKDSFTVFRNIPDDPSSISDNIIYFLNEDPGGTIWIGTRNGGLNKFDKHTGKFTAYKNVPGDTNSLSSNLAWAGYVDREGNLWVGTMERGLNKFNRNNNNFDHYSLPFTEFPEPGMVTSVYEDINKNIWVGTTEGLNKLTPVQNSVNLNKRYNIKRYFNNPPRFINNTTEDEYNNLWICCSDGLIIFNPESEEFSVIKNVSGDSYSLISSNLSDMYKDRDGTIWLQSDIGVSYYNKNKWKFKHSLNIVISNITEGDNNTLFLGTYQGLYSYNRLNNTAKKSFFYEKLPDSWQHNFIYSISPVINNKMLVSMGPFLYSCEFNNGSIYNFKNIPDIWTVRNIDMDHDGLLWLSEVDNDVLILNNDLSEVASIQNRELDSSNISKGVVTEIYEDKDNVIWIGTTTGLDKVVTERNKSGVSYSISFNIKHYKHKIGDTTGLSSDVISYIYEDNMRNLWIGTLGGGLNKYDKSLDKFAYYTTDDGLPDNMIMGILPDNNGNLWISTFKGLSKFNPVTEKFKNYNKMDGLPSDQFFFRSCCKTSDGEMYFGTMDGFVSFYPDSIKDNHKIPPVVLTSFKIFNKETELEKSLLEISVIKLSYRDNFFSFGFSALDYTNPMKNEYMYMLEGIDKDWVKTPASKREASYTDIDPGEYIFRVKGSNNDGVWNEEGVSVKVIITPPWWQTWWFKGCFIILITGLFGGTIRYISVQKIKRRLEVEQERVRISNDMHDEIGSGLTRITLLSEVAKKKLGESEEIRRISEASRDVVQNMDEIVWAVNPQYDTLENLALYMLQYAREFFGMTNITLKTHYPEVITGEFVSAESRHCVFMVIKEVFNNIAKHADATEVQLIFNSGNRIYEFMIQDNGTGFDINSASKFSNGLNIMHKRINMINGNLNIESFTGKGTKVIFKVPY